MDWTSFRDASAEFLKSSMFRTWDGTSCIRKPDRLLKGVEAGSFVYFVHSYYAEPASQEITLATTDHGIDFAAIVHQRQYLGHAISSGKEPESRRAAARQLCTVMNIYPAIDILKGKAVRLKQGRADDVTVYGQPLEMAQRWVQCGAEWLHVVDLDGAFEGNRRTTIHRRDCASRSEAPKVQVGGGMRSMAVLESLFEAGVQRACSEPAPCKIRIHQEALERYGDASPSASMRATASRECPAGRRVPDRRHRSGSKAGAGRCAACHLYRYCARRRAGGSEHRIIEANDRRHRTVRHCVRWSFKLEDVRTSGR